MRYTILEELAREHELIDRLRRLRRELAALKESPEEYFVDWKSAGEWSHEDRTYNNIEDAEERASHLNENTGYETRVISIHTKVHWRSDDE